jgi:hypothetical protein
VRRTHVPVSLSGSGVARAVAGAISVSIGVVFVLPILSGLLPSSWGAHINAYLNRPCNDARSGLPHSEHHGAARQLRSSRHSIATRAFRSRYPE